MNVFVFGGDGYIGWPLSMRLARQFPGKKIIIVDNLLRRRLVRDVGGHSLVPIKSLASRLSTFRSAFRRENITLIRGDVLRLDLEALFLKYKPVCVYHLAQQASAPFSMKGVREAALTVHNNEIGNLKILFALRARAPRAHYVKLGTFGEYAKCGLDIPEGYYYPEASGRRAGRPAPFPRESDDIYHVTKINDTNFISMACRKWGLAVTDIMQATVMGNHTDETARHPSLATRFDYDDIFGTVFNRFMVQVVAGHPMTIYGTGNQRTGLMNLRDVVNSLALISDIPPEPGRHRVINHVTETSFSVNEVADRIRRAARRRGFNPLIVRGALNPRGENLRRKLSYGISTRYLGARMTPTPFEQVVDETLKLLLPYRARVQPELFAARIRW